MHEDARGQAPRSPTQQAKANAQHEQGYQLPQAEVGQGEERRTGQHRPEPAQPLGQYRQQHPPEQGFLK